MTYKFVPKNPQFFHCEKCDYLTCNKKDYNKHVSTQKHQILTSDLQKIPKNPITKITQNNICECGNVYKHRQSLFNHKKKCLINKSNFHNMENEIERMKILTAYRLHQYHHNDLKDCKRCLDFIIKRSKYLI